MLEALIVSRSVEQVLFFLLTNGSCYGAELQRRFGTALSSFQHALDRLERGGVVASTLQGKTRVYVWNPRYPFLRELQQLLTKAYAFLPQDIREKFYEPSIRKRPRKRGKPF